MIKEIKMTRIQWTSLIFVTTFNLFAEGPVKLTPFPELDFGTVPSNKTKTMKVTVQNTSTNPVTLGTFVVSGNFRQLTFCQSQLKKRTNCVITLEMPLGSAPQERGTLTVPYDQSSLTLALVGKRDLAPTASDQVVSFPMTASAFLNGQDLEGAGTFVIKSRPVKGKLTLLNASTGEFLYMPPAKVNFAQESFTYLVKDKSQSSRIATVLLQLKVTPVLPTADNLNAVTDEDTSRTVQLSGKSPKGSPLTFSVVQVPSHGALQGTGSLLTYVPNPNFFGADEFTYKANDGAYDSNVAKVSITVNSVNDLPTAGSLQFTSDEGAPQTIALVGQDLETSSLSYKIVSEPSHGSLAPSGVDWIYLPEANFNGTDSFTYKANDGIADSNLATVTITVRFQAEKLIVKENKSYVISSSGKLREWGQMDSPVKIDFGDKSVKYLDSSSSHKCAILNDDSLKCWGANWAGQLGNGTISQTAIQTPVPVDLGGNGVKAIAVGLWHTCTILSDGAVYCWGSNNYGELGRGIANPTPSSVPLLVNLEDLAKSIFAYNIIEPAHYEMNDTSPPSRSCSILENDTVKCWGYNRLGILGTGNQTHPGLPESVSLGAKPLSLAVGSLHACALLEDHSVKCWGVNTSGQLGIGNLTNQKLPQTVTALGNNVKEIMAGQDFTCAVMLDSSLKCWGGGSVLQNNPAPGVPNRAPQTLPLDIALGGSVKKLSISTSSMDKHACALLVDGTLKCWGKNMAGQVGVPATGIVDSPITVDLGGIPVKDVGVGFNHTCALLNDNTVKCWGANWGKQLGNTSSPTTHIPQNVNLTLP